MSPLKSLVSLVIAVVLPACGDIIDKNPRVPDGEAVLTTNACDEMHDWRVISGEGSTVADTVVLPNGSLVLNSGTAGFFDSREVKCVQAKISRKSIPDEKVFTSDIHFPDGILRLTLTGNLVIPAAIVFRSGADAPSFPPYPDVELHWVQPDGTVQADFTAQGTLVLSGVTPPASGGPLQYSLSAVITHKNAAGAPLITPLSATLTLR